MSENLRVHRFKVLADETRLRILEFLFDRPQCVSEIVNHLSLDQSLVSHHLRILRNAELVATTRRGKNIEYQIAEGLEVAGKNQKLDLGCCFVELTP